MLAVVFPGQGSQKVGMAMDFAREFPAARAVLEEADEATELPLSRWIQEGRPEYLQRTEVTQPAVLAASIAMYRVIQARLPELAYVAGHSLGEYSALVVAGALELAEAVRLVRQRGLFMQEAVPEGRGKMVAVTGLESAEVARVCAETDGVVAPANFNAPLQTVIAGERTAVDAACAALEAAGARRLVPLEVSAPFHCALMEPAMHKFAPALAAAPFREARIPVVSNVSAQPYRAPDEARQLLQEQLCAPVRWVECVRRLIRAGVRIQLEVGPGRVLSGLAARIDPALARAGIQGVEGVGDALARVEEALA